VLCPHNLRRLYYVRTTSVVHDIFMLLVVCVCVCIECCHSILFIQSAKDDASGAAIEVLHICIVASLCINKENSVRDGLFYFSLIRLDVLFLVTMINLIVLMLFFVDH